MTEHESRTSAERLLAESPPGVTDVPGEADVAGLRDWWDGLTDQQFASVWVSQVVELAADGLKVGALALVLSEVRDRYRGGPRTCKPMARGPRGEKGRAVEILRSALAAPGVESLPIRDTLLAAGVAVRRVPLAIAAARDAEDLDVHKVKGSKTLRVRMRRRTPEKETP